MIIRYIADSIVVRSCITTKPNIIIDNKHIDTRTPIGIFNPFSISNSLDRNSRPVSAAQNTKVAIHQAIPELHVNSTMSKLLSMIVLSKSSLIIYSPGS